MGRVPLAVGRRGATFAIVAVSSQFVVKCACAVFGGVGGCPTDVEIEHGSTPSVVFVVLLYVIIVSRADSTRIHGCVCHFGSLSFILSVLILLFGHHRRLKLA